MSILERINAYIWNGGLLFLLLGTGLAVSVKTVFFQLRGIRLIAGSIKASLTKGKGLSQWRVCTSALAASMGTGNIAGVIAAIYTGGAGAVFWMWVSAFFGMMLTYSENVLSMRFRRKEPDGSVTGGAFAYLRYGLGSERLASVYGILCIAASLGMGNMTQSSTAADAVKTAFDVPHWMTGIIIAVILGFTVLGGIKGIGKATGVLLPFAALSYMLLAAAVILMNIRNVPSAFREIFSGAFGIRGVAGGAVGTAVSAGLRHGVFSNEAGLGSSALIHSNAEDEDHYLQGMWSIFEVFLDTMVCCTLTALAVLCTDAEIVPGTKPAAEAFSHILGELSEPAVSVMTALFAFCTMLGWCCCGETAVRCTFRGKGAVTVYRWIFCICAAFGAAGALSDVWTLSDIANGLMAVPNLLGVLLLIRYVGTPAVHKK